MIGKTFWMESEDDTRRLGQVRDASGIQARGAGMTPDYCEARLDSRWSGLTQAANVRRIVSEGLFQLVPPWEESRRKDSLASSLSR